MKSDPEAADQPASDEFQAAAVAAAAGDTKACLAVQREPSGQSLKGGRSNAD